MDKVSVIIPAYNSEKFIREAVESALRQTYANIEVIVVDDGSTDGTRDAIADYIEGSKVKLLRQPNSGQSDARNKGIGGSTGGLIAFLDSDDVWLENKIERQVQSLRDDTSDVVFCAGYFFDGNGEKPFRCIIDKGRNFFEMLSDGLNCAPSGVLLRRRVLDSIGLFDRKFPSMEDFDLFLRVARAKFIFSYLDEPLYKKRSHEDNLTKSKYTLAGVGKLIQVWSRNGLDKDDLRRLKKRLARECFVLARKSVGGLNLKNGLGFLAFSARLSPGYGLKLPSLIVRYLRFLFKGRRHIGVTG